MLAEQRLASGRDVASAPGRGSILIVDDSPSNLLALEGVLTPLAQEIIKATSGEEALRYLLERDFAVILLDVQMPGLDGFETAQLVKSHVRTAAIPIIFITAISRDAGHVFEGYAHGAVDYLLKPIDPDILRSKVSVFVDLYLRGEKIKAQAARIRQTERELAERRAEERCRRLTESMPIAVWAVRRDGQVYYVNRAFSEYTGIAGDACTCLVDSRFVHADDVAAIDNAFRAVKGTSNPFDVEVRLRRNSDALYRWHIIRGVPDRENEWSAGGWIVTATDIDERKRDGELRAKLLQHAEQARVEAEAANRTKDEFLATVSHELRNPLNGILGWVRMLRAGVLDPGQAAKAIETIERNAHAQRKLVDDMLDVSRIITGKFRLQVRGMSLGAVVSAAVDAIRPAAQARGVMLTCDIDSCVQQEMAGDSDRLQQAVWNLVSNAVKFTSCGGSVEVRVSSGDSVCRIDVSDTGIGIAPEFIPHVFDRFRQADSSTTRVQGGLGLGLAIVRHIVELHGGTVCAKSEGPGTGSTFVVELPVRLPQGEERKPEYFELQARMSAPPARRLLRLEGLKVLFVDDDTDARDLIAALLDRCGARAIMADSVPQALEAMERERPDVVVSDIGLPKEDGYSLIRKIRQRERESGVFVPAIAVSGYARADDRRRALAEGFQFHLAKPVEPTELIALLSDLSAPASLPSAKIGEPTT